eukprot:1131738-Pleurochrysis_carterae.AAC.1
MRFSSCTACSPSASQLPKVAEATRVVRVQQDAGLFGKESYVIHTLDTLQLRAILFAAPLFTAWHQVNAGILLLNPNLHDRGVSATFEFNLLVYTTLTSRQDLGMHEQIQTSTCRKGSWWKTGVRSSHCVVYVKRQHRRESDKSCRNAACCGSRTHTKNGWRSKRPA